MLGISVRYRSGLSYGQYTSIGIIGVGVMGVAFMGMGMCVSVGVGHDQVNFSLPRYTHPPFL